MLDLAAFFRNSRDIGFLVDGEGFIQGVSTGAEQVLGAAEKDLVGTHLSSRATGSGLDRVFEMTAEECACTHLALELKPGGGKTIPYDAIAFPLTPAAGRLEGWFIAGPGAGVQAAESRSAGAILDDLVRSIGAALWSFDLEGTILTWSRTCEIVFGYLRVGAEGRLKTVRLFDRPEVYDAVLRGVEESGRYSGEVDLVGADGVARPHWISVTPLASPEGRTRGYTCVSQDLEERKRAEAFQRVMFERAGEAILVVDVADRRIIDVNEQACAVYGYTREEFLKLYLKDLRPPTDRKLAEIMRLLDETGRYEDADDLHLRRDGTVFPAEINVRRVSIGDQLYSFSIVRDATERRQAEEYFRVLFEKASSGILMVESESLRVMAANEKASEMLGYSREDLMGMSVLALHPEFDREPTKRASREVLKRGEGTFDALWHLRSDGTAYPIETHVRVINMGGRRYLLSVFQDITRRRKVEERERFQRTLLGSQNEATLDGILVVSPAGKILSYNRRFVEIWKLPEKVVASRSDDKAIEAVLHKVTDPEGFLGKIRYLYDHPIEESRDELTLKDGRTLDRFSAPVRDAEGNLYGRVWYFRDVTDLKSAQDRLVRSEKLASIGMLVSGVAHEINNPLNVMYGNLRLLAEACEILTPLALEGARARKAPGVAAKTRKFKGMIRDSLKAAEHAKSIVEDFRHFARDTSIAEPVDLNRCVEETLSLLGRHVPAGIRVVRKTGKVPPVRGFRGQINQVILNLVKNALEAIEGKGTVTVRTLRRKGLAVIEVSDTGRGMKQDVRAKIFEPFFTTKAVGQGLGLGLSISASIIQNHKGELHVRSRPGRGTTFRIELPAATRA